MNEWKYNDNEHWHPSACGHEDQVSDKEAHVWGEGEVTTQPTHTTVGTKTYTCTVCGKTRTEDIEKTTDHNWTLVENTATCTEPGEFIYSCECGQEDRRPSPAYGGHNYNQVLSECINATHTSTGLSVIECSRCHYKKSEVLPETGSHTYEDTYQNDAEGHWKVANCGHNLTTQKTAHTWSEWTTTLEPTHDANGSKTRSCTVCGRTENAEIPSSNDAHPFTWAKDAEKHWKNYTCTHTVADTEQANHIWDEWRTTTAASHTANGEKKRNCTVCGYEDTGVIPMDENAHTFASEWTKTEQKHYKASTCGHDVKDQESNHNFTETVTTPATHTTVGERLFTCSVCGYTRTEEIPMDPNAHTFALEWTKTETEHYYASTCGHAAAKKDYGLHDWNIVVVDATPSQDGSRTKTCRVCGKVIVEVIPASHEHVFDTEFKYKQVDGNPYKYNNCSICGEESTPVAIAYEDIFALSGDYLYLKSYQVGENWIYHKLTGDWTIPSTLGGVPVTKVRAYFYRLSELTSITFPSSITRIDGWGSFEGCTNLERINIPAEVTSLSNSLFSSLDHAIEVNIDPNNENYSFENGILYNKDKTQLLNAKNASGAVVIPNTVTTIKENSFYQAENITSVTLPSSVTTIEMTAFYYMPNLQSIEIGSSLNSIEDLNFCKCPMLTEIVVSPSNANFSSENGVLYNKDKTILVSHPSARNAVNIRDSVTKIGRCAFEYNDQITSIIIPDNVTILDGYCFYGCLGLTSIVIPDTVLGLGTGAFAGCENLVSITVGKNAELISGEIQAFQDVPAHITFSSGRTEIGSRLLYGSNLITGVTIPEGVTTIGSEAFTDCKTLTEIILPSTVNKIEVEAFSACEKLERVSIPATITLEARIFYDCEELTTINYAGTQAQWNDENFVSKCDGWDNEMPSGVKVVCTDGVINL